MGDRVGIPVAVILLATICRALAQGLRRARTGSQIGVFAGLVGLGFHDMVDFSLELVGVAVVAAAALGSAMVVSKRGRRARRDSLVPLAVCSVLAPVLLGPLVVGSSTHDLRTRLESALDESEPDVFRETLLVAVALHPAEATFPLLAGVEAARRRDPGALAWLNRAMTLAPGWASPHVTTARVLWGRGAQDQALVEAAEAEKRQAGSAAELLCEILGQRPEVGVALRACAPSREHCGELLGRLARCSGLPEVLVAELDDAILEVDANHLDANIRQAGRESERDPTAAVARLSLLLEARPHSRVAVELSRIQLASGNVEVHSRCSTVWTATCARSAESSAPGLSSSPNLRTGRPSRGRSIS